MKTCPNCCKKPKREETVYSQLEQDVKALRSILRDKLTAQRLSGRWNLKIDTSEIEKACDEQANATLRTAVVTVENGARSLYVLGVLGLRS